MSFAGAWRAGPAAARVSILLEEYVGAFSKRWLGGLTPRGRAPVLLFAFLRVGAVPAGREETVRHTTLPS